MACNISTLNISLQMFFKGLLDKKKMIKYCNPTKYCKISCFCMFIKKVTEVLDIDATKQLILHDGFRPYVHFWWMTSWIDSEN